jgi:quercetin dioxygenase-like cupin family protein
MVFLLLSLLAAQAAAPAPAACRTIAPDAQDAMIAAPENHSVLYEDADVRVLDVHSKGHTREAWHTHARPAVMYVDSQGPGRYMTPTNPNEKVRGADPNFTFRVFATAGNEGLHATENTGDVPFHAIRVEFKHPGCSLSGAPPAKPGPDDALIAAPANHTLLFENDDVRVVDVHVPPHTLEKWHTHPWDGYFYIIQRATIRHFTLTDKNPPVLPPAVDGPKIVPIGAESLHAIENVGDTPLHYIRFELKHATPKAGR